LLLFSLELARFAFLRAKTDVIISGTYLLCITASLLARSVWPNRWGKVSMARAIPTDVVSDRSSPETTRSDKENDQASARNRKRGSMASRPNTNKRQRLADRTSNIQGGTQSQVPSSQAVRNNRFYDPDQDETERRWLRKGLRDLTRDLHGNAIAQGLVFSDLVTKLWYRFA